VGYNKYKEWGRPSCAKDVDRDKEGGCNCCYCDCHCKKEEPKKDEKEECCEDGKLVLVFNTCIDGDVSINESFRDNLKDNFRDISESFNLKDNFRDAVIVKDILSHNAIEILSRNCVDLMIDSARDILNEAFKNALNNSLNGINSDDNSTINSTEVSDNLNHNFSCNKESFELPIANQVSKSSSCAKSEGGSTSTANNDADIITDGLIPIPGLLEEVAIDVEPSEDEE